MNHPHINQNWKISTKVKKRTAELEEANKQKTSFFINIAHETKTPLTLIANYLRQFIKTNGESKEILIIKQNIDKLKNDIVNFFDTEKIERNLIFYDHDQICDLSNTVLQKNIIFKETTSLKNIELKWNIDKDIYTKADPVAIDRILNNLLDNAVKYTENNGYIKVSLIREGDIIKLIVTDTGIGISEEQTEHIFSPYYQLSHQKSNVQGLGMGLHITKQIIESLKGDILVNSNPGKGTQFIVKLKKYEKQEKDIVTKNIELFKPADSVIITTSDLISNEHDDNKKTIFIVEDNLQLVANLKKELEENYNVYFGINGKKALEKLENIPRPDIIISDIMMDVMDGYEFRERLIKTDKYKTIPFIFLTAKEGIGEKLKGLSRGAVDYISKPFELTEMKEKIKSWILLIELKDSGEGVELGVKHRRRLDNLIKEYNIQKRESDVLTYLLRSYKNTMIGEKMFISVNTVKKHLERIKTKLGVASKEELIEYLFSYVYK